MRQAELEPTIPEGGALEDCPAFVAWQGGTLTPAAYTEGLGDWLGTDASTALKVHNSILSHPTEGTLQIVRALNESGLTTACLSNTNELHWQVLTDPACYANIAALQLKTASHLFGLSKPDPAIYRAFEEVSGASGAEILFFEDAPANIASAAAVGWRTAPIDPSQPQAPQIEHWLAANGINLAAG